jgi:hypothetical protein
MTLVTLTHLQIINMDVELWLMLHRATVGGWIDHPCRQQVSIPVEDHAATLFWLQYQDVA